MAERPPCPDPDLYIWVRSRKGGFWRKRRGSGKEAVLNDSLKRNATLTKTMNEAASRILARLRPHLDNMDTRGIYGAIAGRLKKGYNQYDKTDYAYLKELNLQPNYPLESLIGNIYKVRRSEDAVQVQLPVDAAVLRRESMIVTHYFFQLILVQGDALDENDLVVDSEMSDGYEVGTVHPDCILEVRPIRRPWMVLLKAGCIETPNKYMVEFAASPRHYGMKVVAVG